MRDLAALLCAHLFGRDAGSGTTRSISVLAALLVSALATVAGAQVIPSPPDATCCEGDAFVFEEAAVDYSTSPDAPELDLNPRASGAPAGQFPSNPDGGDATAIARGRALNTHASTEFATNPDDFTHEVDAYAFAGRATGSRNAGDAYGEAIGETDGAPLRVWTRVSGGFWQPGGDGEIGLPGATTAIAEGTHTGPITPRTPNVTVVIDATSPSIVDPALPGGYYRAPLHIAGRAVTENAGSASVYVRLHDFGGAPIELRDAASGSSPGFLYLEQDVSAFSQGATAPTGIARTSLDATNPGGGDLFVRLVATGSYQGGDARIDDSSAVGEKDVELFGFSRAGSRGGRPELGRLFGQSTGGGAVTVTAIAEQATSPANIVLENAVDGETDGTLHLIQEARGHWAGRAETRLSTHRSAERIVVENVAQGGNAIVETVASNRDGDLEIATTAWGSRFATNGSLAGASNLASGEIHGDGHELRMGSREYWNALGTSGANTYRSSEHADANGTKGSSLSKGVAHGDSRVLVYDQARGGTGGTLNSEGPTLESRIHGSGGDAASRAIGRNSGESEVRVSAYAEAGNAAQVIVPSPDPRTRTGGDADAHANGESMDGGAVWVRAAAQGGAGFAGPIPAPSESMSDGRAISVASGRSAGEVEVEARSDAGRRLRWDGPAHRAPGAVATAQAIATGGSGLVTATATTPLGVASRLSASVSRPVDGTRELMARAGAGHELADTRPEVDGYAEWSALPSAKARHVAVTEHAGLAELLTREPHREIAAIGGFEARESNPTQASQHLELEIELDPRDQIDPIALAIFATRVTAGGFDSLLFQLALKDDTVLEEHTFGSLQEANSFFSALIPLDAAWFAIEGRRDRPVVRAIFDLSLSKHQEIGFGVALIVPEPSTALLLLSGLLALPLVDGHSLARSRPRQKANG